MRLLTLLLFAPLFAFADKDALPTVSHVDLSRYTGKWYEIARYPNSFEKKCASDVTAEYTLRPDGKITVKNSCRTANGKLTVSEGTAKIADSTTNAKLKVTFFWPFYGNYWILRLADDYSYAVIGEPSRKYLWILSRTPQMNPQTYNTLLQSLPALGYDPTKLLKPAQSANAR